jgi:hypothetical protein
MSDLTESAKMKLTQNLDTTGARAVECFVHQATRYLVIPQLAQDVPGQPALMTVGDSDVDTLVYKWVDGRFVFLSALAVPGGEDAEFFQIKERAFLATASLRTGSGPYDLNAHSTIFQLIDGKFEPFQSIPTFAAKQWKHFQIGERHFIALAQGAKIDGALTRHSPFSTIYEWDGTQFDEFQRIQSTWGYNWAYFELAGQRYLAYADHIEGSSVFRWNGAAFEPFQSLKEKTGRAFCFFEAQGNAWLAFACLHDDSVLYRWNGDQFVSDQVISGPGGRELRWMPETQRLVLINFLHGSREAPLPSLQSYLYRFEDGKLVVDVEFATLGGTDATFFREGEQTYLIVAHSLSADVRFRTESKVYQLSGNDVRS